MAIILAGGDFVFARTQILRKNKRSRRLSVTFSLTRSEKPLNLPPSEFVFSLCHLSENFVPIILLADYTRWVILDQTRIRRLSPHLLAVRRDHPRRPREVLAATFQMTSSGQT